MAGRGSAGAVPDRLDTPVRVTTARVACGNCGPVIVPFEDLALVAAREATWYQFACRTCGRANTVATAPHATDLLVLSGVRIHLVGTPREIDEAHPVRPWTSTEIDAVLDEIESLDPCDPEADRDRFA
jgi:hypothetical protein